MRRILGFVFSVAQRLYTYVSRRADTPDISPLFCKFKTEQPMFFLLLTVWTISFFYWACEVWFS